MSRRYVLDTNTISLATSRRSQAVIQRITGMSPDRLLVSVISYAEIRYGLKRRPEATRLATATTRFFAEVTVLSFTAATAEQYAELRNTMSATGKSLSALDMLIAAQALEAGATLVSNDGAFRHVPELAVVDWTAEEPG